MRPEHNSWYNLKRWATKRKQQLNDHPLCMKCLEHGLVVPAEVVDHVVAHKGNYQKFWFGKLQSLCKHCHDKVKRQEEIDGFNRVIGVDGFPVDPRHPFNREK